MLDIDSLLSAAQCGGFALRFELIDDFFHNISFMLRDVP
jgi:hypothetical protein